MFNVIVKEITSLDTPWDKRYAIVDKDTGEILDDAQGYGYKSPQKACAAWGYKTRDRSKDKEKTLKIKHIKMWMDEHKGFVRLMDEVAFDIAKGSMAPDDKFDAKMVKSLLKASDLDIDFTCGDLLKVWRSYR